jgi:DNA-directed RNA polymerase subunit alpha
VLHSTTAPAAADPTVADMDEIRALLQSESDFTRDQFSLLQKATNRQQAPEFRKVVDAFAATVSSDSSDSARGKVGACQHLLGKHQKAYDTLKGVQNNAVASFVLGEVCLGLGRPTEASESFALAADLGYDKIDSELKRVAALRIAGDVEEAEKALRAVAGKAVSRADYSFQMGCILSDQGDTLGAIEYFERAVDMDPYHTRALFWLANENARQGNDEEAVALYERALSKPPLYVGALMNLGLLYEDLGRSEQAEFCFRRVLEFDPNSERARLFLKDIDASAGMFYDEASVREEQKSQQTLSRPLTDFELSVRSRNCLDRLNLMTIGDLTRITEQELMGSRNFGETSLKEISALLAEHGLAIGIHVESKKPDTVMETSNLSPEQRQALEMPISDLNLSVRARKCMTRLNISVVGEVLARTPDELLGSKNFGVTSLNELRAKLSEMGLSLRND